MASCGILSAKTVLVFLSFVFWAVAAVFCYAGAYVFISYDRYDKFFQDWYITLPAMAIVLAGILVFAIGVIGCCAAVRESRCALASFSLLLLILFGLEVAAAVLGFIYHSKVESDAKARMYKVFSEYDGDGSHSESRAVDYLQNELRCCGVANFSDWKKTPWFDHAGNNSVPLSCCKKTAVNCNGSLLQPNLIYDEGCLIRIEEKIQSILTYIMAVAVAFAFLQMLGVLATCVIGFRPRNENRSQSYEPLIYEGTYA